MTDQELKQLFFAEIRRRSDSGVGLRTSEAEDMWRSALGRVKPRCGYNDGSPLAQSYYGAPYPEPGLIHRILLELAREGIIKWYERGGYCWIVPADFPGSSWGKFVDQPWDIW